MMYSVWFLKYAEESESASEDASIQRHQRRTRGDMAASRALIGGVTAAASAAAAAGVGAAIGLPAGIGTVFMKTAGGAAAGALKGVLPQSSSRGKNGHSGHSATPHQQATKSLGPLFALRFPAVFRSRAKGKIVLAGWNGLANCEYEGFVIARSSEDLTPFDEDEDFHTLFQDTLQLASRVTIKPDSPVHVELEPSTEHSEFALRCAEMLLWEGVAFVSVVALGSKEEVSAFLHALRRPQLSRYCFSDLPDVLFGKVLGCEQAAIADNEQRYYCLIVKAVSVHRFMDALPHVHGLRVIVAKCLKPKLARL